MQTPGNVAGPVQTPGVFDAGRVVEEPEARVAPPQEVKSGSCPDGMAYVPGGSFMMGAEQGHAIRPLHRVTITKPYCIDILEVTLEDFEQCEGAGGCVMKKPKGLGRSPGSKCNKLWKKWENRQKHPINCITWEEAHAYCKWRKKRLPSEAEWEFAARGPESFKFPWGNQPPTEELAWNDMYIVPNRNHAKCADMGPEICPTHLGNGAWGTREVGGYPRGKSPFGVLDMGGNVAEWVQDWRYPLPWAPEEHAVDPTGPATGTYKVIKDFGWMGGGPHLTVAARSGGYPDENRYHTVGVRCALTPVPSTP